MELLEEDAGEATEEEINNSEQPATTPTPQTQSTSTPSNSGQNTPIEHELKIKFINANGDEKELIIKYSE